LAKGDSPYYLSADIGRGLTDMHGTLPDLVASASASHIGAPAAAPTFGSPMELGPDPVGLGRPILLALLVPATLALLSPFWLLASHLASDPSTRAIVAERPMIALQLGAGLLVLLAVFAFPLAALARTLLQKRHVTIEGGFVHVTATGLTGSGSWAEPISAYQGLGRRVRTSLSGVSQELVLVHPRRSRSVVVRSAPHISQEQVDFLAHSFNLAEIPSR
jgi:hypothetical protein